MHAKRAKNSPAVSLPWFIVHPEKSVLEPTQAIQYLGVISHSCSMSVTLTKERKADLQECCQQLLKANTASIRCLAKGIGEIVASFPTVKQGPLYYRQLEEARKTALQEEKGNYDACTILPPPARDELNWWIENVTTAYNDIAD